MEFHQLDKNIQAVIQQFINPLMRDPNVVGIALVGSYAYTTPHKNSDIDIMVVFEELEERERGNTWIDGCEIEYFLNPVNQIYSYLKNDDRLRPTTAHMFANSIILYERPNSAALQDIIDTAQKIINARLPELSHVEIELAKYSFDDGLKDLDDIQGTDNQIAHHLIVNDLIKMCLNIVLKHKRSIQVKSKLLEDQLSTLDRQFLVLWQNVISHHYDLASMKILVRYCENLIGGKRTKEWKLRGPLKL